MKEEALQDVVERLVRIETKLDNYESLREKADSAKDLADKAYSVALNNVEDIKEMKNRTFQFIASKIVTELESQWNYRDFDAILLAGGGGKALAEFILPHFPNMKLVEDPQHANVRGFQKIANKVFKN